METDKIYKFTRMSFWFYLFIFLSLSFITLLYVALFKVPAGQMCEEVYISIGIALVFGTVCVYQVVKAKRLVITPQGLVVLSWAGKRTVPKGEVAAIRFNHLTSIYGDTAGLMDITTCGGRSYRISGLAIAGTSKLAAALRDCGYEYGV